LAHNPIYAIWGRNALADPVLLTAVLFHSGIHMDLLKNQSMSTLTLYHQGEFIQLLNKRLEDPDNATNDSTIAAVALVAASGVRTSV
jgi:hypothetical protein